MNKDHDPWVAEYCDDMAVGDTLENGSACVSTWEVTRTEEGFDLLIWERDPVGKHVTRTDEYRCGLEVARAVHNLEREA